QDHQPKHQEGADAQKASSPEPDYRPAQANRNVGGFHFLQHFVGVAEYPPLGAGERQAQKIVQRHGEFDGGGQLFPTILLQVGMAHDAVDAADVQVKEQRGHQASQHASHEY